MKTKIEGIDWETERIYNVFWLLEKYGTTYQIKSLKKIEKWLNKKVLTNKWFQLHFCTEKVFVRKKEKGEGRPVAHWQIRTMCLPKWSRNSVVILHELAHICNEADRHGYTSHGKEFAGIFLLLVKYFIGKEDYEFAKRVCDEFGVAYDTKRVARLKYKPEPI